MGIKHFFGWLNTHFPRHIVRFPKESPPTDVHIDTFLIDLNGVFHNSTQKIYQYGKHARPKSLFHKKVSKSMNNSLNNSLNNSKLQQECFKDICQTIEQLVQVAKPSKCLVMCIDGVAPQSKQNQQRQRRYRGTMESPDTFFDTSLFDSNCITPGTKFMYDLSSYINWFIHKKMTEDSLWSGLEVIFSDEKVPGEGEHKLINYIRKHGKDETYCINALDADLIMLVLSTFKEKFYLLREDLYTLGMDYMFVDIGQGVRPDLLKMMEWYGSDTKLLITDFILICFLCGNDFLPHIPSIAIIENGLDAMINTYKIQKTHLTFYTSDNRIVLNTSSFGTFLNHIGTLEKEMFITKIKHKAEYIDDPLFQYDIETFELDAYKDSYYKSKEIDDVKTMCHAYLEGCQWVLTYYVNGLKDWYYQYPYHYAPFASDIAQHINTFTHSAQWENEPLLHFQQLMCVLPPKSAYLLPTVLGDYLIELPFCPTTFKINYEGKKKEWEGVVELPPADVSMIQMIYEKYAGKFTPEDMKRNCVGENVLYINTDFSGTKKFLYGNIKNCKVEKQTIMF